MQQTKSLLFCNRITEALISRYDLYHFLIAFILHSPVELMSIFVPLDRIHPVRYGLPPHATKDHQIADEVPTGVEDEGVGNHEAADLNGAVVAWI